MENHTTGRTTRVCVTFAFTLLLVLFLSLKFDFYYDLNDDTMIKDILSGAYTGEPSVFCIQMLYPLSYIIALFYRAIPEVPWYGLFLCLCQFGVTAVVTWRLLSIMKSTVSRLIALTMELLIILSLFLRVFVIIQYSVTSGICMAGAVFLFMTTPQTDKAYVFLRKNLLPAFLVILSFMIRTEVCIMLLPFLLLAGISKWCSETKFFTGTNIKKYVILIITAILGMLAVYSLDVYAYRESEWTGFRSFFDARTKLYDFYGLPDYDGNKQFYEEIGLSKESYTLLENYNFALDESIDTWSLKAIEEYQKKSLSNTLGFVSKNSVREAIWLYKNQAVSDISAFIRQITNFKGEEYVSTQSVLSITVAAAYLVYFIVFILFSSGRKKLHAILRIVMLLLIRSILWLYLYMVDRVLDRVTVSLLMLELVTIISFTISFMTTEVPQEKKDGKKNTVMLYGAYTLFVLCALMAFNTNMNRVRGEYEKRAVADERWNLLMDYCKENGQNYYVIDVYSSTSYNGAPYSEKIFENVDNSYRNYDICGGWAVKSPLTRQKLQKMGLSDVQNALYGKKKASKTKTYFIAAPQKDLSWLVEYYKKRGMDIAPICVDKISTSNSETVFEIYELKKG